MSNCVLILFFFFSLLVWELVSFCCPAAFGGRNLYGSSSISLWCFCPWSKHQDAFCPELCICHVLRSGFRNLCAIASLYHQKVYWTLRLCLKPTTFQLSVDAFWWVNLYFLCCIVLGYRNHWLRNWMFQQMQRISGHVLLIPCSSM